MGSARRTDHAFHQTLFTFLSTYFFLNVNFPFSSPFDDGHIYAFMWVSGAMQTYLFFLLPQFLGKAHAHTHGVDPASITLGVVLSESWRVVSFTAYAG